MMITILPITRSIGDGKSEVGFLVTSGDREIEIFGNSKSATIDSVRALVASEVVREHRNCRAPKR